MNVDNNKPIAVLGEPNSGKTNLAFYLASKCTHKNKYLLGYPKEVEGYVNLYDINDIGKIENAVLIIDEFSIFFPTWEKKSNIKLLQLLRFAEHNKVKLILTTQIAQDITKQCDAFIPQWAIKQVDIDTLKNGSTPKNALKYKIKHDRLTSDFITIKKEEFVWFNKQADAGENKFYTFPFMHIGKDWGNADKSSEKNTDRNTDKEVLLTKKER